MHAQGHTMAPAGGKPAGNAAGITSVTLERDCMGCASGTVFVLRRDGTASLTFTGKARMGTQTRLANGNVPVSTFDGLARLAVEQGFFRLEDSYEEAGLMDGAWSTLTIARGDQGKSVFRREDAGPQALKVIAAAIDALRAGIDFGTPR